jgi:hypothetical protein
MGSFVHEGETPLIDGASADMHASIPASLVQNQDHHEYPFTYACVRTQTLSQTLSTPHVEIRAQLTGLVRHARDGRDTHLSPGPAPRIADSRHKMQGTVPRCIALCFLCSSPAGLTDQGVCARDRGVGIPFRSVPFRSILYLAGWEHRQVPTRLRR